MHPQFTTMYQKIFNKDIKMKNKVKTLGAIVRTGSNIQGVQLNMSVCLWYLVKSDLSRVRV